MTYHIEDVRISDGEIQYPGKSFRYGDQEILTLDRDEWDELEFAIECGAYTDTGEYVYFPDLPFVYAMEHEDFWALEALLA